MTSTKIVSLVVGLAATAAAQMSGDAKIYVVNTTDVPQFGITDPKPFACLDINGGVTLDMENCALYNRRGSYPYILSTPAGICTFQDSKQPENTEASYGKGSYALNCGKDQVFSRADDFWGNNVSLP